MGFSIKLWQGGRARQHSSGRPTGPQAHRQVLKQCSSAPVCGFFLAANTYRQTGLQAHRMGAALEAASAILEMRGCSLSVVG